MKAVDFFIIISSPGMQRPTNFKKCNPITLLVLYYMYSCSCIIWNIATYSQVATSYYGNECHTNGKK